MGVRVISTTVTEICTPRFPFIFGTYRSSRTLYKKVNILSLNNPSTPLDKLLGFNVRRKGTVSWIYQEIDINPQSTNNIKTLFGSKTMSLTDDQ